MGWGGIKIMQDFERLGIFCALETKTDPLTENLAKVSIMPTKTISTRLVTLVWTII